MNFLFIFLLLVTLQNFNAEIHAAEGVSYLKILESDASDSIETTNCLSLEKALQYSQNSFITDAFLNRYYASSSEIRSSGLPAAPEFEIEAENLWSNGESRGLSAVELKASFNWNLKPSGIYHAEKKIKTAFSEIAYYSYLNEKFNDFAKITRFFYRASIARELEILEKEHLSLSEKIKNQVVEKFNSGFETKLQVMASEIEFQKQKLAVLCAESGKKEALIELKSYFKHFPDELQISLIDKSVPGQFSKQHLISLASCSPAVTLFKLKSDLAVFESNYISTAVSAGETELKTGTAFSRTDKSNSYSVSLLRQRINKSQRLFLLNTAEHLQSAALSEFLQAVKTAETEISLCLERIDNISSSLKTFSEEILNMADERMSIAINGYNSGKYSLNEVFIAQKGKVELVREHLNLKLSMLMEIAELEKLTCHCFFIKNLKENNK